SEIFKQIKEVINLVESKTATMAECYIENVKLTIAINQISSKNILKDNAIIIFNCQYKKFDFGIYLLGRICETAGNYWKALGNDEYSCSNLLADLRKYK
ncbi:8446_t:CDS:2, partial [Gigaspora margarita]